MSDSCSWVPATPEYREWFNGWDELQCPECENRLYLEYEVAVEPDADAVAFMYRVELDFRAELVCHYCGLQLDWNDVPRDPIALAMIVSSQWGEYVRDVPVWHWIQAPDPSQIDLRQ
jgi:hypothetical protein